MVLSTTAPAFPVEGLSMCYLAPLTEPGLQSLHPSIHPRIAASSHHPALCCHDQEHHTSGAFHSQITLILPPTKPDSNFKGVLLYFFSIPTKPGLHFSGIVTYLLTCLIPCILVTRALQNAKPGLILQQATFSAVTSRQVK